MPYNAPTTSKKDDLKYRIIMVKNRIKKHYPHYIDPFIAAYPEYEGQTQRIRNVIALVTADQQLTTDLETFASRLDNPGIWQWWDGLTKQARKNYLDLYNSGQPITPDSLNDIYFEVITNNQD